MKKIFKYPLKVADVQEVEIPVGAIILCVQIQREEPCLWALVNPDVVKEKRRIVTYGTGHPVDDVPGYYVGTYQLNGGDLVFHVFDKRGP